MKYPTISVIIAVKNGERYLARAIDSILAQTYQPTEIIIIDGKSTDRTKIIANSYPLVRYIEQIGTGIATAYNQGIDAAKSDFITFLSHDDVWMPDKLVNQLSYLLKYPNVRYTVAQVKFILEQGYEIPSGFKPELFDRPRVAYIMETLMVRKSLFSTIGKFNPDYRVAEDVDWFARVRDANIPGAVIPEVLLHKYIHDTNLSVNAVENTQNLLKIIRQSIQRKHSALSHQLR